MIKRVAMVFVPALLVAGAAVWWFTQRPPDRPVVGQTAPEFSLASLTGSAVSLNTYRGHPVVVNFWATWCEPCKQEMPALQAEAASNQDLVVLGVDSIEPAVKVKPFVDQLGINFPILLDQDGSVVGEYEVIGMPTSFFIDRSGVLRSVYRGALAADTLHDGLAAIGIADVSTAAA
jgi:cytochrome c biogenesis protein CcmG, thiol:disulfide interchange protein DsbE